MNNDNVTVSYPHRPDTLVISLEDIGIDKRYQREPTVSRSKQISKSFDKQAAGRLVVNMREDGTLWLIDGQHRRLAMMMAGIKEWSCDVLYGLTIEEEAKLFAVRNSNTSVASMLEKHHAKVMYKDPIATAIHDMVYSLGLYIPRKSGKMNGESALIAVGCLYDLYASCKSERLLYILTFIKKTWGIRKKAYSQYMIEGVERFTRRHYNQFREDRFIKQLRQIAPEILMGRASTIGGLEGCGGSEAMYRIFVREYNHNLGASAKLPVREDSEKSSR